MRLSTKFNLLVVAILVLGLGITSAYLIENQRRLARRQLLADSRAQGELLALIAPDAIVGLNFLLLDEYVRQVNRHTDVAFVAIFDRNNRPLTSYIDYGKPAIQELGVEASDGTDMMTVVDRLATIKRILIEHIAISRHGKALGELVVATDTRRIDDDLATMAMRQLGAYGAIIALLGLAIYAVFRVEILRPIQSLMRGAQRVAAGDYERNVEGFAPDELGTLTDAFNAMMGEIKLEREQLAYQANYDILTGLPNRKLALERMELEVQRSLRDGVGFCVMFVDLDNFKYVNDTLGHAIGDKLLQRVGNRFREQVRSIDLLARLGGDEFLVMMTSCNEPSLAHAAANRLVTAIKRPIRIDELEIYTRCSIGLAFYPADGASAESLMSAADSAMYSAKADPSASIHFYTKEMNEAARLRLECERDIYAALQHGEFFLAFHPVVRLDDFSPIGAEVLLRWQHPVRGLVPPDEFIPVAERTGQIVAVGNWVLEQACAAAARLTAAGLAPGFLAVNVSRHQIKTGFDARVIEILHQNELSGDTLVLEITESTLMDEAPELKDILDYWRGRRIKLSLDDFGTGFSSLSYLRNFSFDTLKIDKSFVDGLPDNDDSRSLVGAIIAIADKLGMAVVAEGVETQAQRQCLMAMGCLYFQGYLHRKPMTFDTYRAYLQEIRDGGRLGRNRDKGQLGA